MNQKAFTLVELLMVVTLIGILASVSLTVFSNYTDNAKATTAKSNHKFFVDYFQFSIPLPDVVRLRFFLKRIVGQNTIGHLIGR